MKTLTIILSIIITLMYLTSDARAAQDYSVKTAIVIPADFSDRYSDDRLERYKIGATGILEEVRQYFSTRLNGHTFKTDQQIYVIRSKKSSQIDKKIFSAFDLFEYLNTNERLIEFDDKSLWVIWQIGSQKFTDAATINRVVMNHHNLIVASDRNSPEREVVKGVLSHELGHAFGLLGKGFTGIGFNNAHPCTAVSQIECTPDAPIPLPDAEEFDNGVMGGGLYNLKVSKFNNTPHNPEVTYLYTRPYINQLGSSPPPLNRSKEAKASITSISEKTVERGGTFDILGTSLKSNNPDKYVSIWRDTGRRGTGKDIETYNEIKVLEWDNDHLKVQIGDDKNQNQTYSWRIKVALDDKTVLEAATEISILSTGFAPQQQEFITLNLQYNLTCGVKRQPVNFAQVWLWGYKNSKLIDQPLATEFTDLSGKGELRYTVINPVPKAQYLLSASPFNSLYNQPETRVINIPDSLPDNLNFYSELHYPDCEGKGISGVGEETLIKSPNPVNIKVSVTCGDKNLPQRATVRLSNDLGNTIYSTETEENGLKEFAYFPYNPHPAEKYSLSVSVESPFLTFPNPLFQEIITTPNENKPFETKFHYPKCKEDLVKTSVVNTNTETKKAEINLDELTPDGTSQIIISSDPNFSQIQNNISLQDKNTTDIISADVTNVSNDGDTNNLYIGVVDPDGETQVLEVSNVEDEEVIDTPNGPDIKVNLIKRVIRVKIGDRKYSPEDLDSEIEIDLDEFKDNGLNVPIEIEYDDGSKKYLGYHFNLPEEEQEEEEDEEKECPDWEHLRNECTSCGKARSVYEDQCTGNTEIREEDVDDEGCNDSDWCQDDEEDEQEEDTQSTICTYSEAPRDCPYGGTRVCTGTDKGQGCHYNPDVDPNCRENCNEPPAQEQYVSECGRNGGDEYCNLEIRGGDPDNPNRYGCDFNSSSQYGDGCYDR